MLQVQVICGYTSVEKQGWVLVIPTLNGHALEYPLQITCGTLEHRNQMDQQKIAPWFPRVWMVWWMCHARGRMDRGIMGLSVNTFLPKRLSTKFNVYKKGTI